jgi:hypothetical protein
VTEPYLCPFCRTHPEVYPSGFVSEHNVSAFLDTPTGKRLRRIRCPGSLVQLEPPALAEQLRRNG